MGNISASFKKMWRFSPIADPLVSTFVMVFFCKLKHTRKVTEFHSRDMDAVISEREAAAVNDWTQNR